MAINIQLITLFRSDFVSLKESIGHLVYNWVSSAILFLILLMPVYLVYWISSDVIGLPLPITIILVILATLILLWCLINLLIVLNPHDQMHPHTRLEKKE